MESIMKNFKFLTQERTVFYRFGCTIPPGGKTDALVEAIITWNFKDHEFRTRAVEADQTEAAIKATVKMLNIIEKL